MTYDEYIKKVYRVYMDAKGTYRWGQAYFNTLHDYKPELAEKIRGTHLDPFYMNETRELTRFFIWLEENW